MTRKAQKIMNTKTLSTLTTCCALALLFAPAHLRAQTTQNNTPPAPAQSKSTTIASIDAYSKAVDQFIKRNQKSARIFANVASDSEQAKDNWREFKTEKARDKADTGDNLNENAYVWSRNGKLVGANFTFQSPSRDWAHFVMYYFREDGTLAKTESTLNTFYGNVTIKRNTYYDPNGKALRTTTRYLDLNTQKPIKPKGDFFDEPTPVYPKVSALPFHHLLVANKR